MRQDVAKFVEEAERYRRIAGISEGTLSTRCLSAGSRLAKIRREEWVPRESTVHRARKWMRDHPPETYHQEFPRGNPTWRKSQE